MSAEVIIVTIGVAVLFTLLSILIGRVVYGRRIRRWAMSKNLTLVDWRMPYSWWPFNRDPEVGWN